MEVAAGDGEERAAGHRSESGREGLRVGRDDRVGVGGRLAHVVGIRVGHDDRGRAEERERLASEGQLNGLTEEANGLRLRVHELEQQLDTRTTALEETVAKHEPAMARRGPRRRPIRFFYATQAGIQPPTFVLFCTEPAAVLPSYRRFLENQLRSRFDFAGTPVRLRLRARRGGDRKG